MCGMMDVSGRELLWVTPSASLELVTMFRVKSGDGGKAIAVDDAMDLAE